VSGHGGGEDAGLQRRLYEVERNAGWGETTFGEECAHLHEEVSKVFRAYRRNKDAEARWTCERCGRSVSIDTDLDTIRHPGSNHHYTSRGEDNRIDSGGHDCRGRFKPTGVPPEIADVVIGCFYIAEQYGFDLMSAVEHKSAYNAGRNYQTEGRQLRGTRTTPPAEQDANGATT
jgi:hypothetical protein